jgi:hypothetical protein
VARLYADENFPLPVVEALRHLGHDVLTMQDSGRSGQAMSDEEVIEFAQAEQRTLITLNRRHFVRLHGEFPEHSGIIVCSFDPDFIALAQRIHACSAAQPSLARQLVRINRPPA